MGSALRRVASKIISAITNHATRMTDYVSCASGAIDDRGSFLSTVWRTGHTASKLLCFLWRYTPWEPFNSLQSTHHIFSRSGKTFSLACPPRVHFLSPDRFGIMALCTPHATVSNCISIRNGGTGKHWRIGLASEPSSHCPPRRGEESPGGSRR